MTDMFDATEANFQAQVLDDATPVLIDFWAEWCGPCKMIEPIVHEIATEHKGRIKVGRLDADTNRNIMMQYGIMGIPTLILFKGGEPVERLMGYQPKDKIMKRLLPHLS